MWQDFILFSPAKIDMLSPQVMVAAITETSRSVFVHLKLFFAWDTKKFAQNWRMPQLLVKLLLADR